MLKSRGVALSWALCLIVAVPAATQDAKKGDLQDLVGDGFVGHSEFAYAQARAALGDSPLERYEDATIGKTWIEGPVPGG